MMDQVSAQEDIKNQDDVGRTEPGLLGTLCEGGKKYDSKKVPVHLLPPDSLWEIAKVLGFGAQKYDEWNWYKGISYSRLFAACMRHLWQWWRRQDSDPESSLSHLAHAGCCLLFLLQEVLEKRDEQDDRPAWKLREGSEGGVTADGEW